MSETVEIVFDDDLRRLARDLAALPVMTEEEARQAIKRLSAALREAKRAKPSDRAVKPS